MGVPEDRLADTVGLLRAVNGQDYDYGGDGGFGRSYDCSGIDVAVLRCLLGYARPQGDRMGLSTESWRLAEASGQGPLGTLPGPGPDGTLCRLYFRHGGGGPASHTAGELAGVWFESSGSGGVAYGDPMRSTRRAYFTAQEWHLPNELVGSVGNPDLSGRGPAAPAPFVDPGPPPAPAVVTFGVDVSNHQGGDLDVPQIAREGYAGILVKLSEGTDYIDPWSQRNLTLADQAGMLRAGYHYVREGDPQGNAACWDRAARGDRGITCMLDVEIGSGRIDTVNAVAAAIRALGYRVVLHYLPQWYWRDHIGQPDLSRLGPLMASSYGSDQPGYGSTLYDEGGRDRWQTYGGADVQLLQFSQRAVVAGRQIDAWAFRGTRDRLAALLAGDPAEEDPLMAFSYDDLRRAARDGFRDAAWSHDLPSRVEDSPISQAEADAGRGLSFADAWMNTDAQAWRLAEQITPAIVATVAALAQANGSTLTAEQITGAVKSAIADKIQVKVSLEQSR